MPARTLPPKSIPTTSPATVSAPGNKGNAPAVPALKVATAQSKQAVSSPAADSQEKTASGNNRPVSVGSTSPSPRQRQPKTTEPRSRERTQKPLAQSSGEESSGRSQGEEDGYFQAAVQSNVEEFQPGTRVQIRYLNARSDLNGREGTIVSWDKAAWRYKVDMEDGQRMAFGPKNVSIGGVASSEGAPSWIGTSRIFSSLEALFDDESETSQPRTVVMLCGIAKPKQLGDVLRTLYFMGADAAVVVWPDGDADNGSSALPRTPRGKSGTFANEAGDTSNSHRGPYPHVRPAPTVAHASSPEQVYPRLWSALEASTAVRNRWLMRIAEISPGQSVEAVRFCEHRGMNTFLVDRGPADIQSDRRPNDGVEGSSISSKSRATISIEVANLTNSLLLVLKGDEWVGATALGEMCQASIAVPMPGVSTNANGAILDMSSALSLVLYERGVQIRAQQQEQKQLFLEDDRGKTPRRSQVDSRRRTRVGSGESSGEIEMLPSKKSGGKTRSQSVKTTRTRKS
eukprot:TRINITY_DN20799_c0_g1_i1.p1 TRINITY_DN20799_c0_g1~~TRINITY_DN20799_c0_g1_i1.p1  ORF type:complete len:539 (-),score=84.12 TRINITY_DN20799_c0_g1_i1:140-1681(-)